MAAEQDCAHGHVEDFVVDDTRLTNSEHQVRYLKCVDCGLITPNAAGT